MLINEIRINNLVKIIESRFDNSWTKLAYFVEKKQPYLAAIKSGTRPFSEKMARYIELKLGLEPGYLDKTTNEIENELPNRVAIPVYGIKLSAGSGCNILSEKPLKYYHFDELDIKESQWNAKKLCVFKVAGDSMEPEIINGQEVLVNSDEISIIDNKYYAFCVNDEVFIKKLFIDIITKKIKIKSVNESYDDVFVNENEIKIIGRVVLLLARKV